MTTWRNALAALVATLLLSGCFATPDLSGWAQNSATLATTVSAENTAILNRMDKNIATYRTGKKIGWDIPDVYETTWNNKSRKEFAEAAASIDAGLMAMTLYADALAKLAAAGETGKEAVDKGHKAIVGIAELVGVAFPAAPVVVSIVKEIAGIWTRKEAQDGLAAAMTASDPKVDELTDLIVAATDEQRRLVRLLGNFEDALIEHAYGENVMLWFYQNDPTTGKSRFDKNEQVFADALKNKDDTVVAAAHTYLLEALKPRAEEQALKFGEVAQWRKTRNKALDGIVVAAKAWRASHRDVAAALAECGGLRAFRFSCGGYTAENIRFLADRIKNAIADKEPDDGDVASKK